MDNFLQSGTVNLLIWIVFLALTLYLVVAIWSHLSLGKLFWQNLFGSNRVALPKLSRAVNVPGSDSGSGESQALVLVRVDEDVALTDSERRNVIYPMAGRNGLHFWAERCSSCQLCSYVCPTGAISTQEITNGYERVFNLSVCIFCGLCEAACPTHAVRLTLNEMPLHTRLMDFVVQGEVQKEACPECGRVVPQTDLRADYIYDLKPLAVGVTQSEKVCDTCQQTVLKAEEEICA